MHQTKVSLEIPVARAGMAVADRVGNARKRSMAGGREPKKGQVPTELWNQAQSRQDPAAVAKTCSHEKAEHFKDCICH